MKLLLTLLVTAVIFTSCGKKDDVKTTDSQKKDSTTQTKTETTTKTDTTGKNNSAGGIKNISYEPGKLPASVKYEGKIVAGARNTPISSFCIYIIPALSICNKVNCNGKSNYH